MLDAVLHQTGLDEEVLKSEIRSVHRKHGTSEYAFVLEETPSLKAYANGRPVTDVFAGAIDAFREGRRSAMELYPSVMETLEEIKNVGCLVVGYTESMAFYTGYRIRKLNLDRTIDFLFSPEDHDLPANMSREEIRKYPSEHYKLLCTKHEYTPKGELKPNPHILQEIIRKVGVTQESCVYVGDSLHKDIAMAKDAGVDSAWAKYGIAQHRREYELLREVTHWTDEDVEREKHIKERHIDPDNILRFKLSEILQIFEFQGKLI